MSNPFAAPGSVSGIDYNEMKGHLLMVSPIAWEPDIKTTMGVKDALRADVVDLTDGTEYADTLIFPRVLASSLRSRIGQKVLATLTQGVAKPGQNPPWILEDASGDSAAVAKAQAWLNKGPDSAPAPAKDDAAKVAQAFGAPPF